MIGRSTRLSVVVVAVGLAGVLAASAAATTSGRASAVANLAAATKTYSAYVGGSAGKADPSKSTITIGFVNDEGGIPSFPEGSVAAQAAVKFANAHLHGIGGHPVKLAVCAVAGSEEQGQKCAQQFLANSSVKLIVEDSLVVGSQTFHQTLAGKIPVLTGTPNAVASAAAKNTYGIGAGVFGTDPAFVSYAVKIKAKTAALIFPADDPTGQAAAKQIKDDLTKAGVTVTAVGYSSSSTDILPVVQASGAASADVTVTLLPSPPTCIAGAKAIAQLNLTTPVLSLAQCIAEPVKQALGDYPKWTYVSISTNYALPSDPATAGYVQVMKAYAPSGANAGGFAPEAFSATLAAIRMYNHSGGSNASAAKLATTIKAYKGPTPMLAPKVKFGIVPGLPALGTVATRLYTYQGSGKWLDAAGGAWVGL
jgi:branched-chain amino acid transport system substrate-binding protein